MKTIQPLSEQRKKKAVARELRRWHIVTAIVIGVLLVAALVAWALDYTFAQKIDKSSYQVVYLTNGQAYFGKLQNTGGEYLVMKDPYTAQSVVAKQGETQTGATTTLLKVSQQVYGPQDSIAIKSDQVSFWQNLRSDSKVAAAIKQK